MFKSLKQKLEQFHDDISGATAIEYSLIAGLIFLVIVAAVQGVATNSNKNYTKIEKAVQDAVN